MTKDIVPDEGELHSLVLDHAEELVREVAAGAKQEYERLLNIDAVRAMLAEDNAFNRGKLYVYAEYRVFRDELRSRFPEVTDRRCVNAFCRLFLKNDISLSNLIAVFEKSPQGELRRLRGP